MHTYKRVNIYMTLESIEILKKLSKKYKQNHSELIRNMLKKRVSLKSLKHLERELESTKKALLLLSRVPNNLNQIARKLNENETAYKFDEYKFYELVEELKDEVKETTLELKINNMLLKNIM